ncbi:MAG: TetR/AcrR family transcriptional regulator [Bacteroidota bacterium]
MAKQISRRQKVINTTLKLLSNGGFHASPMSEVAQISKVAVGTIYHHFPSKEALFDAVHLETCTEMAKLSNEIYANKSLKPAAKLTQLWVLLYQYLIDEPQRYHALIQYRNTPPHIGNTELEGALTAIKEIIKEGQKQNKFSKLHVSVLFEMWFSMIIAAVRIRVVQKKKLTGSEIKDLAQQAVSALKK